MENTNFLNSKIFFPTDWLDYELIDFGNNKKLERFGRYVFIRPDNPAICKPCLSRKFWEKADGEFSSENNSEKGNWKFYNEIPKFWDIKYNELNIKSLPTPFRHLGFFPEQSVHWKWCRDLIKSSKIDQPRVLNLFGYSGIASLDAAIAGASVTHVDASK